MSPESSRAPAWGYAAVAASAILFSAKAVVIKLCYRLGVEPMVLMTLRMLFSLPFFLAMAAWPLLRGGSRPAPLARSDAWAIWGLGGLGYYLSSVFDLLGLQYISAGMERLILYVYPTLVVLFSIMLFRKPVGRGLWAPLALAYGGIALSFGGEVHAVPGGRPFLGGSLVFLSAVCYALFLIGSGRLVHRVGPRRLTAYAMLVSSLAVFVQFFFLYPVSALARSGTVYALALVVAIFSTVIPTLLLAHGMKAVGASRSAVVSSVGPASTFALAALLLGERPGWMQAAGLVLTLAGGLKLGMGKEP